MKNSYIKKGLFLSLFLLATTMLFIGCMDAGMEDSSSSSSAGNSSFHQSASLSSEISDSQSTSFSTESSVIEASSEKESAYEEESSLQSSYEESSNVEEPESSSSTDFDSSALPHKHAYTLSLVQAPSCEREGITEYSCECGNSYQDTLAPLGHSPVTDSEIAPSCVKTGLTEGSHCSECNKILIPQERIELIDHVYNFGYCHTCNLVGLEFVVNVQEGYATCTNYTGKTVRRVVIPDEYCGYPVKVLAPSLFEGCTDLYSIEIGENVEIIGDGAFHQCYHLVEIYDRSKAQVTKYNKLDNGALTTNAEDDDIHYEPFESKITIVDDFVIFNDDGESILLCYLGSDKNIVIPEGVTRIDQFALAWEYQLVEVTIASTVNYIESLAFYLDLDIQLVHFLNPDGWEARKESKYDWVPFEPNDLIGGENGKIAVIDLCNSWEWRKVS